MKVGSLCSRSINAKVEKLIWCFSVSPADQPGFSTRIVSTWRSPVSARGSFLLCDQTDFQSAAKDSSWECNLLAKDLLQLAASSGGYGDRDGYDSDDYFDAYYE